jgi:hypothetical protein
MRQSCVARHVQSQRSSLKKLGADNLRKGKARHAARISDRPGIAPLLSAGNFETRATLEINDNFDKVQGEHPRPAGAHILTFVPLVVDPCRKFDHVTLPARKRKSPCYVTFASEASIAFSKRQENHDLELAAASTLDYQGRILERKLVVVSAFNVIERNAVRLAQLAGVAAGSAGQ